MTLVNNQYHQPDRVHHFCCPEESSPTLRSRVCTCMKKILFHRLPLPFVCILATVFIILHPSLSWALQTHDAPEGLFVHQMSHLLFVASLVYLAWDIHRNKFSGRGWVYLQFFCVFMSLWNVLAFTGHAVAHHLLKSDFFTESTYFYTKIFGPFTSAKITFYIAKLDHLVSVPALVFLFLALRTLYHSIETEASKGEVE